MSSIIDALAAFAGYEKKEADTALDGFDSLALRVANGGKVSPDDRQVMRAAGKSKKDLADAVAIIENRKRWQAQYKQGNATEAEIKRLGEEEEKEKAEASRIRIVYLARSKERTTKMETLSSLSKQSADALVMLQETAPRAILEEIQSFAEEITDIGHQIGRLKHLLNLKSGQYYDKQRDQILPTFMARKAEAKTNIAEAKSKRRSGWEASLSQWEDTLAFIGREEAAAQKQLAELVKRDEAVKAKEKIARAKALTA